MYLGVQSYICSTAHKVLIMKSVVHATFKYVKDQKDEKMISFPDVKEKIVMYDLK